MVLSGRGDFFIIVNVIVIVVVNVIVNVVAVLVVVVIVTMLLLLFLLMLLWLENLVLRFKLHKALSKMFSRLVFIVQ